MLIDRLDVTDARTTLGVDQCPSGNMEQQAAKMKAMTELWAAQMKAGYLKRSKTWLSLRSALWTSLEYRLNATTLTKAQCEDIMTPALTVALNGMGICRLLPRTLVHGTVELQGLGLPHLYTLQGIAHAEDIMVHTALGTLTGDMLRANMEQLIIDVGVGDDVLNHDFDQFGVLTPYTLMANFWEFLSHSNLRLQHDIEVPLRRHHDQFLMRVIGGSTYSTRQLQAIN